MIKLVCEASDKLDSKDIRGETPVMLAMLLNRRKFIQLILASKADPNAVSNDTQKISCMHIAAATMGIYWLHDHAYRWQYHG